MPRASQRKPQATRQQPERHDKSDSLDIDSMIDVYVQYLGSGEEEGEGRNGTMRPTKQRVVDR